tara:strand:+ start:745 stop:1263 length:519 start_codon:yes stop_codon:yes gene_type:complete
MSVENKILKLLKESYYSISDISRKIKSDRRTVTTSLEKLNQNGLVEYRKVGMAKVWSLSKSPLLSLLKNKKTGYLIKSLLDNPLDGISIIDEHNNVVWINEKLRKKFGNKKGVKCYELLAGKKSMCPHCTALKSLKSSKSMISKGKIKNSKYDFITIPLKDKKLFVEIIRNI